MDVSIPGRPSSPRSQRWHKANRVGVLAFLLLGTSGAHAQTLEALLRLPMEQLLKLQITARNVPLNRVAPAWKSLYEQTDGDRREV